MIIEATGIEKSFGQLQVLKGIDLQAGEGEIVSIMGASGAGKSTLLQILGTLSTPDKGSLTISGRTVFSDGRLTLSEKELSAWRNSRLGFVFQFHHLLPEFTALENVMIPALIGSTRGAEPSLRRSDRAIRSEAEALLADMGLKDRTGHKPSELSGGEQSRVAIARALINHPAILLADEPSGNLDSATKKEIHQLFLDLRVRYGQSIIIVTHDPSLAALCDRILMMRDGLFENNNNV